MYYVIDTTRKNNDGQSLAASYNTVEEVVAHLEVMCPRLTNKTRSQLMSDAADLGFGDDDIYGKNFTNMMIEQNVNIGVIRQDGQPIRCDIHNDDQFSNKTEYGH